MKNDEKKLWTDDEKKFEEEFRYLIRGTENIVQGEELRYKLKAAKEKGRPLIVKEGVDPTAPEIHLGHAVTLRKLRHFQDLGHNVKFLIGDFTARIGDPTDRASGRKVLTEEEVLQNAETYKEQIFKILNPERTEIVYNSSWLKPKTIEDFVEMLYRGTVNDMIKRKSIAERLERGDPVTVTEFIYPFLQAYDSIVLEADIEVGGTDQYFNFMFTRDLQRSYGQEPEVAITMPLLVGTDGKEKMSKSLGNHIGINENPDDMYGKIMSVQDSILGIWYELLTNVPMDEIARMEIALKNGSLNPKEAKAGLAKEIVTQYHGLEAALEAEKEFERVFRYKETPKDIPEIRLDYGRIKDGQIGIVDLVEMTGHYNSRNEIKDRIMAGAVKIDDKKITDVFANIKVKDGQIIKVGKRTFARLKYESG